MKNNLINIVLVVSIIILSFSGLMIVGNYTNIRLEESSEFQFKEKKPTYHVMVIVSGEDKGFVEC